jgi:hypothetical protein
MRNKEEVKMNYGQRNEEGKVRCKIENYTWDYKKRGEEILDNV